MYELSTGMVQLIHTALYTRQLEVLRDFYVTYFQAVSNEKYVNPRKGFESYFLSFGGEARLEIMYKEEVYSGVGQVGEEYLGLTHFALSVGGVEEVQAITELVRTNGYKVVGEPRWTGDGYYESVILDPDGNRVELVAEKG